MPRAAPAAAYQPQQPVQQQPMQQQYYAQGAYGQEQPQEAPQEPLAVPEGKTPSGIYGFDDLIEGGFETGSVNLLLGGTGCGKTTFLMQFLYNGATQFDEPAVLLSFEEPKETLYNHMLRFGWDFASLEEQGLYTLINYKPHEVKKLVDEGGGLIWDAISAIGAKRLAIDSLSSYTMLFESQYTAREAELSLFELLRKWGCTSLLSGVESKGRLGMDMGYLADSVTMLYHPRRKNVRFRALEVAKMRGSNHSQKLCPFEFVDGEGMHVYPGESVFYELADETEG